MFQYSVEENLIHLFWKQSYSYLSDVLTFALVGYRKLINCSKLPHSETTENPVIDYSHLGKITATTKIITYFPSLRCAPYNQNFHWGMLTGVWENEIN